MNDEERFGGRYKELYELAEEIVRIRTLRGERKKAQSERLEKLLDSFRPPGEKNWNKERVSELFRYSVERVRREGEKRLEDERVNVDSNFACRRDLWDYGLAYDSAKKYSRIVRIREGDEIAVFGEYELIRRGTARASLAEIRPERGSAWTRNKVLKFWKYSIERARFEARKKLP